MKKPITKILRSTKRACLWLCAIIRKNWATILIVFIILVFFSVIFALSYYEFINFDAKLTIPEVVTSFVQISTFLVAFRALYLLNKRTKAQDKILQQGQNTLQQAQDTHIETLFNNAVGYLAKDAPHIRMSGIDLLEDMAKQHEDEYCEKVYKILLDYLRYEPVPHAKGHIRQAIIDTKNKIIDYLFVAKGSREKYKGFRPANLERAQLQGSNLNKAQLQGAVLWGAQLQGASLLRAQLQRANLDGAQLQGATLIIAQLQGARLVKAQLEGANLRRAQLQGANLSVAQLQGANLRRAQLQGANLSVAQLEGARLSEAQLQGAELWGAQLQGADLDKAQLQGAFALIEDKGIRGAFKERIQERIDRDTELDTAVFSGNLTQERVDEIIQMLDNYCYPEKLLELQEKLQSQVGKKANHDVSGRWAITGILEKDVAEGIIAEYEKAMSA